MNDTFVGGGRGVGAVQLRAFVTTAGVCHELFLKELSDKQE